MRQIFAFLCLASLVCGLLVVIGTLVFWKKTEGKRLKLIGLVVFIFLVGAASYVALMGDSVEHISENEARIKDHQEQLKSNRTPKDENH